MFLTDNAYIYPATHRIKRLYSAMKDKTPKKRAGVVNLIDYTYTNYDNAEVTEKYNEVSEKLASAQMALDKINAVESIEIEID